MDSIEGKTVLITGASRGLGAALARAAAARGARVVAVAREAAPLLQVVAEIRVAGGTAFALPADVGDKESVHAITGAAAALAGPIDVVVHNASWLGPTPLGLLMDTACEDLERVLAVNLVGPFRLSKVLAGPMLMRGSDIIVHVSSDAAVSAYPRWGAYGVSKAAFDHLARSFAAELEGSGVRVFAIDPGEMDTRMHAEAMPEADPATLARPEDVAERVLAAIEDAALAPGGARVIAAEIGALRRAS